ncbi:amino acid ABC transporter permease [Neoaquamicrobium sediminum]|uniref:amino acid ABC transporter permease n=1 Tax=Neoaquamicrobium sediminum TaxID=1849104 RepID=UPI0015656A11|nr:amino acid ABC transporter permease [Mesorhizobium sediminum]NRC56694.1 amino acid ABC transporter permease [Mesorhizobium sediminum]
MTYAWDFNVIYTYREVLLVGLGNTLLYTFACIVGGLLVGLLAAFGRLSPLTIVRWPTQLVVEIFRCTPLLVILIWFYYALPALLGVQISALTAGLLALSLYGGSFYGEIIRAGIISIDIGQREAAQALGMRRGDAMRRIILPQALRRMVPPLMNQSILQLKNTSLVSVLALPDLIYQGQLVTHETYRPLEVYTTVAVVYFAILFPATLLVQRLERRFDTKA